MTEYSSHKALHHRDRIDQLRAGKQPAPVHVHLIISDLCNQDCLFCHYRQSGYTTNELFAVVKPDGTVNHNPKRMIPVEKVMEILDDFQAMGVKAVHITGGGEPTVHPQHEEIFEGVVSRGLDLGVMSNGVMLSDRAVECLLEAVWVRFSLDAGTPQTYASVRRTSIAAFTRAISNMRTLVERRQDTGKRVRVGINYVVTRENYREVMIAAELARTIEVDNFRISAMLQNDGARYYDSIIEDCVELCRGAGSLSTKEFQVHNHFESRLDLTRPDYQQCGYQQLTSYIGADLNVYRCCNTAYSTHGTLGSIKDVRFADFWASRAKYDAIDFFDARGCTRCQFNEQNRAILYAIDPAPADVNFV